MVAPLPATRRCSRNRLNKSTSALQHLLQFPVIIPADNRIGQSGNMQIGTFGRKCVWVNLQLKLVIALPQQPQGRSRPHFFAVTVTQARTE